MQGLVLEGGGAKGAFHVGALKALFEKGYTFDGVMGTSIGAMNGAMVAQGDFDKLFQLWGNMRPSAVLGLDDTYMSRLERKVDTAVIRYLWSEFRKAVSERGLSTDRLVSIVDAYLDEEKLRASPCDFGIVTVDISKGWTPIEIFKNEMPQGTIKDYIIASAYFPAFKRAPINGHKYMDGGIYDNMPINPLIRKGYDNITVLRTLSTMPHRKVIDQSVKIQYINPSEYLGRTLDFSNNKIQHNIKLGYYDCLKQLDGLAGKKYYIYAAADKDCFHALEDLSFAVYEKLSDKLGVSGSKREIFAAFTKGIGIKTDTNIAEGLLDWLEPYADAYGMERFRLYSLADFVNTLLAQVNLLGVERVAANKKLLYKDYFCILNRQ